MTMKKRYLPLLFLFLLFQAGGYAQNWKSLKEQLLKQAKKEAVHIAKKSAKMLEDSLRGRIVRWSESYDPAELNYAVSFSDNSGFFEAEDKFETYKRSLIGFAARPGTVDEKIEAGLEKMDADDFNRTGELLYATGHYQGAQNSFLRALLLLKSEGKDRTEKHALVLSNLGLLFQTTGRYYEAEEMNSRALDLREELKDPGPLGASCNNMGVLCKETARYAEADSYLTRALTLTEGSLGKASTAYAVILNNLAVLNQQLGKYEKAEKLMTRALAVAEENIGSKSPNFVRMKVNLAMLYEAQGKKAEAEKIFLEAIAIKKRRLGTKHPDYAVMLQNLAGLYLANGEYDRVEDLLNKALKIYEKKFSTSHPSWAGAMADMGRYHLFMNQPEKAGPEIERAYQVLRSSLPEHHPRLAGLEEARAILEWEKGDYAKAFEAYRTVLDEYIAQINRYFPALSEYGQASFWHTISPRFQRFFNFSLEAGDKVPEVAVAFYDYRIATKALLLNTSSRLRDRILRGDDRELKDVYNRWLDLRQYLGTVYSMTNEEIRSNGINVDSLENVAAGLEKELSARSGLFGQEKEQQDGYEQIREKLGEKEALVELVRLAGYDHYRRDTAVRYLALVVTKEQERPQIITLPAGNGLEKEQIAGYRRAMQQAKEKVPFAAVFWGPVEKAVKDKQMVYVSPDGIYNFVNINTLQFADGSFVVDRHAVCYLTNTRDLLTLKKTAGKKTGNTAVLAGNPQYDLGFDWDRMKDMPLPPLPGTEKEVKKVNEILRAKGWKTTLFLKEQATEEKIRGVRRPRLLHLATHGYFLPDIPPSQEKIFGIEPQRAVTNPLLRSGLLFTGADKTIQNLDSLTSAGKDDGILNAYEASMMDLSGTDMVVLSACETGLGEVQNGEGVYGLQRSFQLAGASSVMISLWQVSDVVTQKLMSLFYTYWLQTGDKQKAFLQAQREIKKEYPAPFFWGAFVLVNK